MVFFFFFNFSSFERKMQSNCYAQSHSVDTIFTVQLDNLPITWIFLHTISLDLIQFYLLSKKSLSSIFIVG